MSKSYKKKTKQQLIDILEVLVVLGFQLRLTRTWKEEA
jgi:hypothetical protein